MSAAVREASVVLCTRNRPALVRETIQSLLAADPVPAEIVVIDQSDTPAPELAGLTTGQTAVVVVPTPPEGLGRARNAGIAAARHEVLVFVDDDMWADPGWLGALLDALAAAGDRAVVTGAVLPAASEAWRGFTPSTQEHLAGSVFEGRLERDELAGGHMACRREALVEVGCFDPRLGAGAPYPAADDNDLGFRLLEAGYRIVYVADAVLYHRAWRPAWGYPLVRFRYGRGKGGFYAKHRRAGDGHMRRRAARDVTHRLRRFPRLAVTQPVRAVGDLFYIAGVAAGAASWLSRERGGDPGC